jgi:hypothetical protein
MLAVGRLPLRVLLHARRVGDQQLTGQVVDDLGRHPLQRVRQKPADKAGRGELDTEAEPVVITPQPGHQLEIGVIEVEELLQVRLGHRVPVTAEGRRFLVTEKLHRHGPTVGPDHHNPASK